MNKGIIIKLLFYGFGLSTSEIIYLTVKQQHTHDQGLHHMMIL